MKKRWLLLLLAAILLTAQVGGLAELPRSDYAPPEEPPAAEEDFSGREPAYMVAGVDQAVDPLDCMPDSLPGTLVLPDGTTIEVAGALPAD